MRNQLSNLLLGDTHIINVKDTLSSPAASPVLPEPPVVVHVKGTSKTGT
jgi:hypothetical protein